MFAVHVEHGAHHLQLPFGIYQRKKLVHIAVSVPQRKDGITVALGSQNLITLHSGIFPVHILQDIGMYQRMIECRIKNGFLFLRTSFYKDARKVIVPAATGFFQHLTEVLSLLLGIQIEAGILHAHKRDSHLYFHLLAFFGIECKIGADIISRQFLLVAGVKFVASVIGVPFGLYTGHGALLLPVARSGGLLVDTHHKVDGKNGLWVVAESTQQLHTFKLAFTRLAQKSSRFIGQAFAQVQQHMALPGRKGETRHTRARSCRHFRLHIVASQEVAVISGGCLLVLIAASIFLIIYGQLSRSGHQQQRTQFRTAHTAQIDMRVSGEETIVILIGSGPPAGIFIVFVVLRTHHVEGHYGHHSIGTDGSRIRGTEVSGTDKRIHIVRRMLLRSHRCREHSKGDDTESNQSFHNIVRICSLLVSEHATHAGVIACTLQSYCKRSAVTLQTTLQ